LGLNRAELDEIGKDFLMYVSRQQAWVNSKKVFGLIGSATSVSRQMLGSVQRLPG